MLVWLSLQGYVYSEMGVRLFWHDHGFQTYHCLVDVARKDDVLDDWMFDERREEDGSVGVATQLLEDTLQPLLQRQKAHISTKEVVSIMEKEKKQKP